MKFVKRITIFFIMPMVMFAGGFAASTAIMEYFYPGRAAVRQQALDSQIASLEETLPEPMLVQAASAENGDIEGDIKADGMREAVEQTGTDGSGTLLPETDPALESYNPESGSEPESIEVSLGAGTTINADTVYAVQEYDKQSGDLKEEVIPVPETFIGMDRELFTQTMSDFSSFPPLKELEKGFAGCEVISFAPQKVVVRKTYEQQEMPEGYYLLNENNFVTVYYGDMRTVYMNTNITLQQLPEDLRQEILYIKFMAGEEELYNFLETYSS